MPGVSFGHSYIDVDFEGFEKSLDEEFSIQIVKTLRVKKAHDAKASHSDSGPRRSNRKKHPMLQILLTYDGYAAHQKAYMEMVV